MKKNLLLLISFFLITATLKATSYNITIVGLSYSPATLTVNVGDVITIEATDFHPLVQVSQTSWNTGDNTQISGGFSSTTNYTFTITSDLAGTSIYYLCSNHALSGMKGIINVNVVANIQENKLKEFNFTVYPNPIHTESWINLSLKKSGSVSLTVYDLNGRILYQLGNYHMTQGETTIPLDASRLQKGNYILQMRTDQGVLRKQILVL